jgi:hypothetical protein
MNTHDAHPRGARTYATLAGLVLSCAMLAAQPAIAQTGDRASRNATPTTLRIAELALETSGRDLTLPATDVGMTSVRSCETCRPVSLLLGTRSRFLLDGEATSLPALRATLAAAPQTSVVVLYARGGSEITRIIATSPPAARR